MRGMKIKMYWNASDFKKPQPGKKVVGYSGGRWCSVYWDGSDWRFSDTGDVLDDTASHWLDPESPNDSNTEQG